MPALDRCHTQVKHALEKDEWRVAGKPYPLFVSMRPLLIDIKAEREGRIILVEAKCFPENVNSLSGLYASIGQYMVYRSWLEQTGLDAPLYLAVPTFAYQGIFSHVGMKTINDAKIKLIVVNLDGEVIERWLE